MEKDWVLVLSADKMYKAELFKDKLDENDIISDILNKKGSAFLLGDVEVYVHKDNEVRALEIIKEFGF
jgi:hypothetical protein